MTSGAPARYLRWMTDGHQYFTSCLEQIDDARLDGSSALPGWSGRHLLSHIGHNARALARLAHWAATGEPTPMYASPSARVEEIESGAGRSPADLREFVAREQEHLVAALDRITEDGWQAKVVTAQGRTVPASTIPWLRSRELWIHACDLPSGGDFAAFPDDFVDALISDALNRRRTAQSIELSVRATDRDTEEEDEGTKESHTTAIHVEGPAADLAQWLTGRGASPRLRAPDSPVPQLPAWL